MQEGEKVAHRESGVVGTLISAGQGSAAVEWIGLPWVDHLPLCDLVSLEPVPPTSSERALDHMLDLTAAMFKNISVIHQAAERAHLFGWRPERGEPIDRAVRSLEELTRAVSIEISAFV